MTVTYCDITKKEIENATTNYAWRIRNRRYDVVYGRDISVEGMQELESEVFKELAKNERFNFLEYKKALADKITDMTE